MVFLYLKLADYVYVERVYHVVGLGEHIVILLVDVRIQFLFDFFERFLLLEIIIVEIFHLKEVSVLLSHVHIVVVISRGLDFELQR
jgi:hypothetical protein